MNQTTSIFSTRLQINSIFDLNIADIYDRLIIVHFCLQQLLFTIFNFEKTGLKDHLVQLDIVDPNVME